MKTFLCQCMAAVFFFSGCNQTSRLDDPLPAPQSDTQELAFGVSRLGFDLYGLLASDLEEENFVFSPYSISSCLGMAYAGAAGRTAEQMADALHYSLPDSSLHETFGLLTETLVSGNTIDPAELRENEEYELTLTINSGGWLQQDYGITEDYTGILENQYSADVRFVDYVTDFASIDDDINAWADNATSGKIPALIGEGDIDSLTRLVLVHTVYLKGSWQYPFDENQTANGLFHALDGREHSVPMMTQTETFGYAADDLVQAVSLPLVQGTLSLVVLLPREGLFAQAETALSAGGLYSVVQALEGVAVRCTLPRFTVRTRRMLNGDLIVLGMTDAFSVDDADFSGITGIPNLFITLVIHEAVIEVNETGIEAAAATAVAMAPTAIEPAPPIDFTADRPFFYAIYDHEHDVVLFLGRVMVPGES